MAHEVDLVRASSGPNILDLLCNLASRSIKIPNRLHGRDSILQRDIVRALVECPHARVLLLQPRNQKLEAPPAPENPELKLLLTLGEEATEALFHELIAIKGTNP